MESYFLLNEQVHQFLGAKHQMRGSFGLRGNENDAKINLIPVIPTTASKAFSEKILQLGNTDQMLDIQVMMYETVPLGSSHEAGYMAIEAKGENHILHKIWCMTDGKIKVNWKMSDFGVMNDQGIVETDNSTCWESEGNELFRTPKFLPTSSNLQPVVVAITYTSLATLQNIPAAMLDCWKNKKSFVGTFSITIVLDSLPLSRQLAVENDYIRKNKKMLHQKIETDLHLVSKDGRLVKCHKAMLAVSNEILSRKIKRQNEQLEVDFMQHLSFECIQAVLSFMYYGDVSKVTTDVKFAIEILQAAIDFRLIKLVSHVQQYLVLKPRQDFLVGNAVKLFLILRSSSSVENDSYGSGDEDESSENDNESLEGEDENESQEDERNEDDDSEAESDRDVNGPQRTGKGIRLSSCTRKRGYPNGHGTCLKKPRTQIDDNLAGISGTSAEINGNGEPHPEIKGVNENNVNCTVEDNADDYLHYTNLLEKQAIDVILWYRKNSPNSLKEAVKYHQLVKFPEVLLEIFNLSIQPLQQQQEEDVIILS